MLNLINAIAFTVPAQTGQATPIEKTPIFSFAGKGAARRRVCERRLKVAALALRVGTHGPVRASGKACELAFCDLCLELPPWALSKLG